MKGPLEPLSPDRVRALSAWVEGLTPQEAVRVRALARNCGNCVHFEPHEQREERVCFGVCCVGGPTVLHARVDSMPITIGPTPVQSRWPEVTADRRCGRWNHPTLPLSWLSGLSGVELDQAARTLGVEVPHG